MTSEPETASVGVAGGAGAVGGVGAVGVDPPQATRPAHTQGSHHLH